MSKRLLGLLLGSSALAIAQPALAQATSAAPTATRAAPVELGEVIVTGTRIKSGFEQPTPVTVVSSQQLQQAQPTGVAAALIQLPQFNGSSSPRNLESFTLGQAHGNILNLRNVGPERTLILRDGVRVPPTTATGLVDVDTLPELLVSRVDVVTGGVSAVYGSDAVTGVVNYILDKDFTGYRGLAQGGVSDRGDVGNYRLGFAAGQRFGQDRGHVLFSIERNHSDGILRSDRPLAGQHWFAAGVNPTAANAGTSPSNPYRFYNDVESTLAAPGGVFFALPDIPPGLSPVFPNGLNSPFNTFGPGGFYGYAILADGTFHVPTAADIGTPLTAGPFGPSTVRHSPLYISPIPDQRTLVTPSETDQGFLRLSYDVTPAVNVFFEGALSGSRFRYGSAINFGILPIFSGNAYLPPAAQAEINASTGGFGFSPLAAAVCGNRALPAACLSTQSFGLGLPTQKESIDNWTIRTGLKAELGGWTVDFNYVHGHVLNKGAEVEINNQHFYAALDAVRDPSGNIVCRVSLTNPGLYPGCVPYNPFGFANFSPAAAAYVLGVSTFETTNITNDVVLTASGEPFSTWAGPVGASVGIEYRDASLSRVSNSDPAVPFEKTGLRGISPGATLFSITSTASASGSDSVTEANVEMVAPLAKDVEFAHLLEVSGAARFTDYSTSGTVWTWKLGGNWEPFAGLRFRATRSRDIRAPTLYELFLGSGSQLGALQGNDPRTGLPANDGTLRLLSGGNPDLKPEIGDTTTVGVVYQPEWLAGFRASLDYYDIDISQAITTLTPDETVNQCEASGGTSPLCARITRDPVTQKLETIFTGSLNAASLKTSGFDVEALYQRPVGPGNLVVRLLMTYVDKYELQNLASEPLIDIVGTSSPAIQQGTPVPKWSGAVSANYTQAPWSFFVQGRWIGEIKTNDPILHTFYEVDHLPAVFYVDTTVTFDLPKSMGESQAFLTVNNLFDKDPPLFPGTSVPGVSYPTIRGLYDVIGRTYTAGVRFKF